jgi:hypothetical protein
MHVLIPVTTLENVFPAKEMSDNPFKTCQGLKNRRLCCGFEAGATARYAKAMSEALGVVREDNLGTNNKKEHF